MVVGAPVGHGDGGGEVGILVVGIDVLGILVIGVDVLGIPVIGIDVLGILVIGVDVVEINLGECDGGFPVGVKEGASLMAILVGGIVSCLKVEFLLLLRSDAFC